MLLYKLVIWVELSKNDKIELTIDALTSEGSGVGRYDGLAVFVRGTVPDDRIIAHIIKKSKNYAVGIIDRILEASVERIQSDCTCSDKCGGCSFRNMTYDEELKYKKTRVEDALKRIGHINIELDGVIPCEQISNYRNKAQYPVSICDGELFAGFYAYKSHRIIPCTDCKLQPIEFSQGIEAFSEWVSKADISSYDEKTGRGLLRHIYMRKGFATGEVMACAVINGTNIPDSELLVALLKEKVNGLKSVMLNINTGDTNVVLSNRSVCIWGSPVIYDKLLGKSFCISPNSFYQVNHDQCERLYLKALEFGGFTGEEVLVDLYCGVGTIGLTMAEHVRELIGIEIVPQAIENAKENARINGVANARYICADAPEGARLIEKQGVKPNVVILDPPRKGCDKSLFDIIEKMSPDKIIYISCDPATLARDLDLLRDKNYITKRVAAVDLFPRTPHIESVALLIKENN